MTWKEFKEKVEEQGVTDEMDVLYIDVDDMVQEAIRVHVMTDSQEFSID